MKSRNITKESFEEQVIDLITGNMFEIPGLADIRSTYTPAQKLTGAMAYVLTGSAAKAADLSGLSSNTLRKWKEEAPWWDTAIEQCRQVAYQALDQRLGLLIEEVLDQLESRLKHGETVVVQGGKTIKVPIASAHLVKIFQTAFDRRQLVRGDVTSRTERVDTGDKLKKVQEAAISFGREITSQRKANG